MIVLVECAGTDKNSGSGGGSYASEYGPRVRVPVPSESRRRCQCGCKTRATHTGRNNGIALVTGCEMYIRRWVRDGAKTRRRRVSS